jgi:hypothetical protein
VLHSKRIVPFAMLFLSESAHMVYCSSTSALASCRTYNVCSAKPTNTHPDIACNHTSMQDRECTLDEIRTFTYWQEAASAGPTGCETHADRNNAAPCPSMLVNSLCPCCV